MPETPKAEIGVFGGSGFYELLDNPREHKVNTPFGAPSSPVMVGEIGGTLGRLPAATRQGPLAAAAHDQLPGEPVGDEGAGRLADHRSERLRFASARGRAGSLRHLRPVRRSHVGSQGHVLRRPDHDARLLGRSRTARRCVRSRSDQAAALGITAHSTGTVVVIQGPRFSTRSESKWFASQGWEVINMTQYPECYLARELEICYVQHLAHHRPRRGRRGRRAGLQRRGHSRVQREQQQGEGPHLRDDSGSADEARLRVLARARGRRVLGRSERAARRVRRAALVIWRRSVRRTVIPSRQGLRHPDRSQRELDHHLRARFAVAGRRLLPVDSRGEPCAQTALRAPRGGHRRSCSSRRSSCTSSRTRSSRVRRREGREDHALHLRWRRGAGRGADVARQGVPDGGRGPGDEHAHSRSSRFVGYFVARSQRARAGGCGRRCSTSRSSTSSWASSTCCPASRWTAVGSCGRFCGGSPATS